MSFTLADLEEAMAPLRASDALYLSPEAARVIFGPSQPMRARYLVRAGGKWRVRRKPARGRSPGALRAIWAERERLGLGPDGAPL